MSKKKVALVLSGGGARAAYQVGVLKAIAHILNNVESSPFSIICGTSAGAINAVALASNAARFQLAVRSMVIAWHSLRCQDIYRASQPEMLMQFFRFAVGCAFSIGNPRYAALLDNTPLTALIHQMILFDQLDANVKSGILDAVCITCSNYFTGQSVSFFQGQYGLKGWHVNNRIGVPTPKIDLNHLLASTALPGIFPLVNINNAYYGDGGFRQSSPSNAAIHLGADKILIIGVNSGSKEISQKLHKPPHVRQTFSALYRAGFLDLIEDDANYLERINRVVAQDNTINIEELRPIDLLVIRPRASIEEIAMRYRDRLPKLFQKKWTLNFSSYLLFDATFCKEVIRLGYRDTMDQIKDVQDFFSE